MTYREKLMQEHTEYVSDDCIGGCKACPCDYGYEKEIGNDYCVIEASEEKCRACWDREMHMTRFDKITQSPEALTDWITHDVCPSDLNDTACLATLKRNNDHCPYEDENEETDCTDERLAKCWIAYLTEDVT